jgi:hypothetical protein
MLGASIIGACGDDGGGNGMGPGSTLSGGQPGAATAVTGGGAGSTAVTPAGSTGGASVGVPGTPGGATSGTAAGTTGTTAGTALPANFGGAGSTAGASLPGGTVAGGVVPGTGGAAGGAAGGGTVPTPTFLDGPVDGDPSKPVVAIQGIPCSGGSGGALGGLGGLGVPVPGTANTKITNRDVIISYPCNKHEGAQVTFILNLHGTMMDESLKFYQHGYFAAYALATSHNLIVAEPKSVVSQWGNGDNGADKPHLYDVIDWVYTTFGTKFKITGLWVGGHSWGSMFAKTFACDDKLKERVRGVIGMSGGATGVGSSGFGGFTGGGGGTSTAGCADRVSQIHTVGDQEGQPGVPDQTTVATKHGCKAMVGPKDIGNMQMLTEWPECSPGWTHFNFVMGAHQHTTPINPEVVQYIIEGVKKTEKK